MAYNRIINVDIQSELDDLIDSKLEEKDLFTFRGSTSIFKNTVVIGPGVAATEDNEIVIGNEKVCIRFKENGDFMFNGEVASFNERFQSFFKEYIMSLIQLNLEDDSNANLIRRIRELEKENKELKKGS